MKIVFRVDAAQKTGIGHVMRCMALSEELRKRNNECFFLSSIDSPRLIKKIKASGASYDNIGTNISRREDLQKLLSFSKEKNIDWIVTDHYGITSQYLSQLKLHGFKVLSIDDCARIHYFSDIVVNQNIGAEHLHFSAGHYTKFLLGPKYVLLRDELLQRRKKRNRNDVKKILITFGGSDPDNLTLKILRLLDSIHEQVELLVIIGPANRFYNQIKTYARRTDLKVTLLRSPENMAEAYLASDVCVSAGGSSCYELAYFGIPNIIITVADNQLNIAHKLKKQNISIYLGKKDAFKATQFKDKIKELIENDSLRKNMSKNGRKLVDGKGKKRIVDCIEGSD